MVDVDLARLHGARTADCGTPSRAQDGNSHLRWMASGLGGHPEVGRPRVSRGGADSGRRRRIWRCDRDGGPAGRGLAGGAQHRGQRDLHHLHGPAGNQFGRRGARRTGGRPQIAAGHRRLGLDGACCWAPVHEARRTGAGFVPRWIVRLYTPDAAVIAASAMLLRIAALFELFDGLQVVATGALRGLGDTRTPSWRTWPAIGSSVCPSRTCCASRMDGV